MSSHQSNGRIMNEVGHFSVRLCGCGVVHLNFGSITINATPEVVLGINETLNEVANAIALKQPLRAHLNKDLDTKEVITNVITGHFTRS